MPTLTRLILIASSSLALLRGQSPPDITNYYCSPNSNCYDYKQGLNYWAQNNLWAQCSNTGSAWWGIGITIHAVNCSAVAQSTVQGFVQPGIFNTPDTAYVNAQSYTYYGNYADAIDKDCAGGFHSTGNSFGNC